MDTEGLLNLLRNAVAQTGGQSTWARENGMSAQYVTDVLAGRRAPAGKIVAALGYERVVTYRRLPTLDDVVSKSRASDKPIAFPEFGPDKPARGKGKG